MPSQRARLSPSPGYFRRAKLEAAELHEREQQIDLDGGFTGGDGLDEREVDAAFAALRQLNAFASVERGLVQHGLSPHYLQGVSTLELPTSGLLARDNFRIARYSGAMRMCYNDLHYSHGKRKSHETANHYSL